MFKIINPKAEGEFSSREQHVWRQGERSDVIKRTDNLRPEGNFAQRPDDEWAPGRKFYSYA